MMIISNTKNIFLKRLKRMKKMIAADCSSQESEEESEENSQASSNQFPSSGFLSTIKTDELSKSSHDPHRQDNSLVRGFS